MASNIGLSLIALVLIGVVAGTLTSAAFSDTSDNSGNAFQAGSVAITDNDSGDLMMSMSNAKPGASSSSCINVTYGGSLNAGVRLYGTTTGTGLDQYLTLTVTRGSFGSSVPAFATCTGFSPDPVDYLGAGNGVVYNGTLQGFADGFASGTVDPIAGSAETWSTGESHAYRFVVSLQDNSGAEGLTAQQTFTWEARSA
jgi:predicted ribosomally synthesized peptide with SipW-like signal peptide